MTATERADSTPATRPDAPPAQPDDDGRDATAGDATPPPEPWTAERVSEWNAYYDVYVVLGVLLLAFVASANRISNSTIWTHLKAGEVMASKGAPLLTDLFSYTEEGRRWVNIPWLFEWGHFLLYKACFGLIPVDPNDPTASVPRAEQVGAGALVALNALARVLTLFFLIKIRRPGPGLWWVAIASTLALGAVYTPVGVLLGGIAGPGSVGPATWGLLLLAVELWILHRTLNLRGGAAVYGLIPLFALWANLDDSFLIGLILLAAAVVGRLVSRPVATEDALPPLKGLVVWAACAAACLVNPSTFRAFPASFHPFLQLVRPANGIVTPDQLSFFGKGMLGGEGEQAGQLRNLLQLYYLLFVGVGLASFALNRRRFSWSRLLVFVAASLLWAALMRFGSEFAIVFATTLGLNGQEWYQDRFGTDGRLGKGWAFWSTGGRFVTILLLFALVAQCLTGYGRSSGETQFGFGFDADDFAFEAADFLRTAKVEGRVLNTSMLQGDSINWRAYPSRRTFIDSRQHLFPPEVQEELQEARRALSEDAVDRWKPILDRHAIDVVMVQESQSPKTYRRLMQSIYWIPFYDDGLIVMFGRADAKAGDLAFFKANRIDAEAMAYRRTRPVPPAERPPATLTMIDQVFRYKFLRPSQPHTDASERWLEGLDRDPETPTLPSPARCLLAIREARVALSRKPDDTRAYRILSTAYRDLMIQETALIGGLTLTPADARRVAQVAPRSDLLMNRFRQRVTCLNYAIQTTPPPRNAQERMQLYHLNFELFQLYLGVGFVDLARDRVRGLLAATRPGDLDPEFRARLGTELGRLDDQVKQIEEGMSDLVAQRQAGPLERGEFALSQGAPGLAIVEFMEAKDVNVSPMVVTPKLLDLYCDTGQPDKALFLLESSSNLDDPQFGTEPGTSPLRQGRVQWLLGNYDYAATLWKKNAIPALRFERSFKALGAGRSLFHGEAKSATTILESIPGKITTQALWENDLAFCRLEGGEPELAAQAFTDALTLAPNLPTRAVIAYYLEKLGKPVPPRTRDQPAAGTAEKTEGTRAEVEGETRPKPDAKPEDEPKPKHEPRDEPESRKKGDASR